MFSYHGQRDNLTPMAIITATLDPVSIAQIDANCKMLSGDVVRQICLEVLKEVSDPILEYAIVLICGAILVMVGAMLLVRLVIMQMVEVLGKME